MGFIRNQEVKFAAKLIAWKYQKMNYAVPSEKELLNQAAGVVDEAHRIARERGSNVAGIVKELISDLKKKS